MASIHFLVLGEEARQKYLAEMLREQGHEVMVAESYQPGYHDVILLPVPQSAQYFENNYQKFQKGQTVFGCQIPDNRIKDCEAGGIRVVDYMKAEGMADRNAVSTAEGAIAEALQEGCVSIQGSRCLVVGYGTCGSVLASKLGQWKAHVTVMDRKEKKREAARSFGFEAVSFEDPKEHMGMYDIVFNTVPAPVLTEDFLGAVKPDVTVIDLASKPGGVDFDYCRKKGIRAKLCLGLPGKYAPKSAAGILMEVIKKTILGDERNGQKGTTDRGICHNGFFLHL